ncbi:hypothetical protein RCZ04_03060 [Capnocytophaga sp. HP1101]
MQWGVLRIALLYAVITIGIDLIGSFKYLLSPPADLVFYFYLGYFINFVFTWFMAGFYFWLYAEWKCNFWLILLVHILIRAYEIFAFGGGLNNYIALLFKALPAVALVIGTIIYRKIKKQNLVVKYFW